MGQLGPTQRPLRAARVGHVRALRAALEAGADINGVDRKEYATPTECARCLLEVGAEVKLTQYANNSRSPRTLLEAGAEPLLSEEERLECVRILLEAEIG